MSTTDLIRSVLRSSAEPSLTAPHTRQYIITIAFSRRFSLSNKFAGLINYMMYERISQEQTRCGTLTFDTETAPIEPLRLDPNEHVAQPAKLMEHNTSVISGSTMSYQSVASFSTHEEDTRKDTGSTSAATLKKSALHEWLSILLDALLALVPLLFLSMFSYGKSELVSPDQTVVIAIMCLCLDSQPISSFGENVKAVTLLSPTIFPIVYAAILGKALRRVGLFKAERSSTIGVGNKLIPGITFELINHRLSNNS